jgi:hypothetical protein
VKYLKFHLSDSSTPLEKNDNSPPSSGNVSLKEQVEKIEETKGKEMHILKKSLSKFPKLIHQGRCSALAPDLHFYMG